MKPIIGITSNLNETQYQLNKQYCEAIIDSGGIPLILPCVPIEDIPKISSKIDGLLLSGGGDIHGDYFKQSLDPRSNGISVERDELEISICKVALSKNLPILGICRGIQILNVSTGGNIIQHIDNHSFADKRNETVHLINVKKDSLFYQITEQKQFFVNSIHHQCVGSVLGENVKISALSNDGMIEVIEITNKKFAIGVQWHPEAIYKNYIENFKIFQSFIKISKI